MRAHIEFFGASVIAHLRKDPPAAHPAPAGGRTLQGGR
jgi:hypothetical protein